MKLLMTGPLTLGKDHLLQSLKEYPELSQVNVTAEFFEAHKDALSSLPVEVVCFPLEVSDFGICAVPVRQIEMVQQSTALLVLTPGTVDQQTQVFEPNVNLKGLLDLSIKNHLISKIIKF